jgi:hypothetical protein
MIARGSAKPSRARGCSRAVVAEVAHWILVFLKKTAVVSGDFFGPV